VTVQDPNLVDVTSIDKLTGNVILTISDHLDWADTIEHQQFPDAKGRAVTISIVFKFKPDAQGLKFLDRAIKVVESAGCYLRYEIFPAATTSEA
jgi:hypothetical protein